MVPHAFGIGGGRWGKLRHSLGSSPKRQPARPQPSYAIPSPEPGCTAGAPCSCMRPCMPSQRPCLTRSYLAAKTLMAIPLQSAKSSRKLISSAEYLPRFKETGIGLGLLPCTSGGEGVGRGCWQHLPPKHASKRVVPITAEN